MDYNEVKVNLRKFAFPLSTENALNQIRMYPKLTLNKLLKMYGVLLIYFSKTLFKILLKSYFFKVFKY